VEKKVFELDLFNSFQVYHQILGKFGGNGYQKGLKGSKQ